MQGSPGGRLGTGPDASIESRLPFAVGIIVLVFGVFVVRLFQLQILQGEELEGIAQGNAVRLSPARGAARRPPRPRGTGAGDDAACLRRAR